MFGIGFPELIVIIIIGLLVFGPNKLPDLAKAIAKGLQEFKKATQEMKENLDIDENLKEDLKGIKNNLDGSLRELKAGITDSMDGINKSLVEEATTPQDTTAAGSITETTPVAEEAQATDPSTENASPATHESPEPTGETATTDLAVPVEPHAIAGPADADAPSKVEESPTVAELKITGDKEKAADEGR